MKTFTKLSVLALAGMTLVGCGLNRPDAAKDKEKGGWANNVKSVEPYVQPDYTPDDGYVEPQPGPAETFPRYDMPDPYEEPAPVEPNVQPDLWEGFTPADPTLTIPTAEALSAQSVAEEVYLLLWGIEGDQYTVEYGYQSGLLTDNEDGSFTTIANWGTGSSGDCTLLHEYYTPDFIPEDFAVLQDIGLASVNGTSECYICYYMESTETIVIQEMIYILTSNGKLYSQYKIAPTEYFMS